MIILNPHAGLFISAQPIVFPLQSFSYSLTVLRCGAERTSEAERWRRGRTLFTTRVPPS